MCQRQPGNLCANRITQHHQAALQAHKHTTSNPNDPQPGENTTDPRNALTAAQNDLDTIPHNLRALKEQHKHNPTPQLADRITRAQTTRQLRTYAHKLTHTTTPPNPTMRNIAHHINHLINTRPTPHTPQGLITKIHHAANQYLKAANHNPTSDTLEAQQTPTPPAGNTTTALNTIFT